MFKNSIAGALAQMLVSVSIVPLCTKSARKSDEIEMLGPMMYRVPSLGARMYRYGAGMR